MTATALTKRFLETTRGQILALLRRGACTVEDLAAALGLTDNAVRNHLSTLERDNLVRQAGVRRGAGAGKPALVYELHPDAETLFSRAYPPVLSTMVEVLVAGTPPEQLDEVLRELGRRLAFRVGGRASGSLEDRVRSAAAVLTALGGDVEVGVNDGDLRIRGSGCPLSASVAEHPELCRAVEAMLSEVSGADANTRCEHGERPRCCFAIRPTESDR